MPDLPLVSHVLPAALALLAYVGAGLGYVLTAPEGDGSGGTPRLCCAALEHYLDTHTVSAPIEHALRRGTVAVGMTRRQVILLRGVPRAYASEGKRPLLIYDAEDTATPSWLHVRFEDGRVASVRRVPAAGVPA
ncbi:hypothetical protein GGP91_000399 [Salinibacter ruber]|uniref:Lipoprotein SmpA/OmlA domain-containing protein n=3 Tax=Salinibacter ruber TaxID=146919 RepID=Q2S4N7_SALRD|nr:hypothetical protein [Salinibacter ruber]ABC46225.1 hypothetical protein SRU_0706 [Salinibacter ruber DSM 13855]MBB4062199.1 hypothetical protein [Salinibacter ruber]MBB4067549.1 hypothetical protein [Salinibacter ruber]MCS3672091.1 hypothetical protein [Salinibacter ruber]MCS3700609.1 hypothetical protein [Salinibacter ruber]